MVARAIIYVPQLYEVAKYAATCIEHCARHGYEVVGLVHGDWAKAAALLTSSTAGIMVVARPDHLPPDREPRVEIADEPASATPPHQRTTLIRRAGAA